MITDEQGREWFFQKLYDAGCRDIDVRDGKAKFFIQNDGYVDTTTCVAAHILGLDKRTGYVDLAEELGIVDWSKVKVDTPVLVRDFENQDWKKRYFAFFDDELIYTWDGGATSWSVKNKDAIPWKYAKLAEV